MRSEDQRMGVREADLQTIAYNDLTERKIKMHVKLSRYIFLLWQIASELRVNLSIKS